MNTKIITHGEPGKILGNTRRNCPYQVVETVKMIKMECDCFPKLFSDMEDADYKIYRQPNDYRRKTTDTN
ncbi:unnamed protein product [Acanthoscelides obtectus]|uniref:Uncharacterized protein n=1 Tax=Acanthoscelides obtectus TaxID=200917 RepID=A0A9P0JMV5_ACAOB|nr:unnamed protein product [Acanthoscelides obtectus]CAK1639743.1 hypothetical protein AOBTE_LOCUS11349 [Acanthoscelides obtectus]